MRDIQRNTVHSASLSLMNLTNLTVKTNIAYISVHAVLDLYRSFEYVVYTRIGTARCTDIGLERLFCHIMGNILGKTYAQVA